VRENLGPVTAADRAGSQLAGGGTGGVAEQLDAGHPAAQVVGDGLLPHRVAEDGAALVGLPRGLLTLDAVDEGAVIVAATATDLPSALNATVDGLIPVGRRGSVAASFPVPTSHSRTSPAVLPTVFADSIAKHWR